MTDRELRDLVLRTLGEIAPDAGLEALDPAADFQERIDIDSMDHLNLVIGLHEATGVDIPERDYPKMAAVDACVAYLRAAPAR